jgi:hypothetical protein
VFLQEVRGQQRDVVGMLPKRRLRDLVEEEGAAVRDLEAASLPGLRLTRRVVAAAAAAFTVAFSATAYAGQAKPQAVPPRPQKVRKAEEGFASPAPRRGWPAASPTIPC